MANRAKAVRLVVPALFVAGLAVVAVWRTGPPVQSRGAVGTSGTVATSRADDPLSRVADALLANSVGRQASLERIVVREITSRNTFWAGPIDERPVFAAIADTVTRARGAELEEGSEVTLIGVVHPAPDEADAIARWNVSAATAKAVKEIGTYLEVTEIR
jgi:hypothetical protein